MATASVIRAQAELGQDDVYSASLARYYEVARRCPTRGCTRSLSSSKRRCKLQRGDAAGAATTLEAIDLNEANELGATDAVAAIGLTRLQLGDVAGAIAVLEGPYEIATDDGPALAIGCRLALAYAAAHRCNDARDVIQAMNDRSGGTYSDRMIALWAEGLVHVQTGSGDGRGSVDAAHAIATATDARLEHAIAALARACVLDALVDGEAAAARIDAERQLESLGITGGGWQLVFDSCAPRGSTPTSPAAPDFPPTAGGFVGGVYGSRRTRGISRVVFV